MITYILYDEQQLPPIDAFYSTSSGEGISEEDYNHAQLVYQNFNCQTFGQYKYTFELNKKNLRFYDVSYKSRLEYVVVSIIRSWESSTSKIKKFHATKDGKDGPIGVPLRTKSEAIYISTKLNYLFNKLKRMLQLKFVECLLKESNWRLSHVNDLELQISKFSHFISTPNW